MMNFAAIFLASLPSCDSLDKGAASEANTEVPSRDPTMIFVVLPIYLLQYIMCWPDTFPFTA